MMGADVVIEVIYFAYLTSLPQVSDKSLINDSQKIRSRRKSNFLLVNAFRVQFLEDEMFTLLIGIDFMIWAFNVSFPPCFHILVPFAILVL